jgi:tellurite resistance protein
MNLNLFKAVLTAFVTVSYLFAWYQGEMIPAWQAAIWPFIVFIDDLKEYLNNR